MSISVPLRSLNVLSAGWPGAMTVITNPFDEFASNMAKFNPAEPWTGDADFDSFFNLSPGQSGFDFFAGLPSPPAEPDGFIQFLSRRHFDPVAGLRWNLSCSSHLQQRGCHSDHSWRSGAYRWRKLGCFTSPFDQYRSALRGQSWLGAVPKRGSRAIYMFNHLG